MKHYSIYVNKTLQHYILNNHRKQYNILYIYNLNTYKHDSSSYRVSCSNSYMDSYRKPDLDMLFLYFAEAFPN